MIDGVHFLVHVAYPLYNVVFVQVILQISHYSILLATLSMRYTWDVLPVPYSLTFPGPLAL